MTSSPLSYRRDIDGLRAVAVLAVVAFHAAPGRMPGGFSGVDVFFVISGYLITSLIVQGLKDDRFSLLHFYDRRIRRIFPALILVLLFCLAAGWLLLVSEDYRLLGKHAAAGAGFASNFVFWAESGYFDTEAEFKPLLHLWSLGIEEQFYVLWPLLLAAAWKFKLPLLKTMAFVASISFAVSIYLSQGAPVSAFYSPFTRAWELLLGSGLAIAASTPADPDRRWHALSNNVQSAVGISLIILGFVVINREAMFPGWLALLPVVGTGLAISAGPSAWLNRTVLSTRAMVWIGLISYPLYLWHWPLLAFPRIIVGDEIPQGTRLLLVLIAVVLAGLTYILLEKPIRHGRRSVVVACLLVGMLVVGTTGYAGYKTDGFDPRLGMAPRVVHDGDIGHRSFFDFIDAKFPTCGPASVNADADTWNGIKMCFQSRNDESRDVALVGDSHAAHLFLGVAEELKSHNVVLYSKPGMPFLSNGQFSQIFSYLLTEQSIGTVILSAHWVNGFSAHTSQDMLRELARTADALLKADKRVFITDDVPRFSFSPNRCKYAGRFFIEHRCTEDTGDQMRRNSQLLDALKAIHPSLIVVRTFDDFCEGAICSMERNGALMFRDHHHLNIPGSKEIGRVISAQLQRANIQARALVQ